MKLWCGYTKVKNRDGVMSSFLRVTKLQLKETKYLYLVICLVNLQQTTNFLKKKAVLKNKSETFTLLLSSQTYNVHYKINISS